MGDAAMGGRVCVVTGANTGIGKATAQGLAERGAQVVAVSRDAAKGQAAVDEMRAAVPGAQIELVVGDLGALAGVRALAATLLERYPQIHVLVNNAGVWPNQRQETPDGFELTFAVNHLAPFLLTHLLLPRLTASAPARIVNLSSALHVRGRVHFDDPHVRARPFRGMQVYSDSKLMNVLFTRELARRTAGSGVVVNAVHPGVVRTELARDMNRVVGVLWGFVTPFLKSPAQGAATSIHVATAPELASVSGRYFADRREKRVGARAHDEAAATRLWDLSAELVGIA